MSWHTNKYAIAARSALRSTGLARPIAKLLNGSSYEAAFDQALIAAISAGDCVWDIGANVGYYVEKFLAKAGKGGVVCAFEPEPSNIEALNGRFGANERVRVVPYALGEQNTSVRIFRGPDDLGATSRIGDGEGGVDVPMFRADDLLTQENLPPPNVIKLDVEGYEIDVLRGMPQLLAQRSLRAACVEVHFGLLQKRGPGYAPRQIECLLKDAGLVVSWTDRSHIVAKRQ